MVGRRGDIMESQNKKDGGPKSAKMEKFAAFDMRGFGNFAHKREVGIYRYNTVESI